MPCFPAMGGAEAASHTSVVVHGEGMISSVKHSTESKNPKRPVILAVDDEESNLILLKRPLMKEGFKLIAVRSGREALKILSSEKINIVLLDWMMPGMSGLEVCEKIKSNTEWSVIPVIMVTAKTSGEDIKKGLEAGANDYVRKPVEMTELLARIRAGLREYKFRRGLLESNERLKKLNKLKNNFLSIVSHDLRTPLNTIVGFSGMMLDGAYGPLKEDVIKPMKVIRKSAQRQLALIDNLLDLAKIESGYIQLERSMRRMSSVLEECCESMALNAELKDINLNLTFPEEEPRVFIDAGKMTQVVNNLLGNAIKFSPKGGVVDVGLCFENENMLIKISDKGPGIAQEDMSALFSKFQQLGAKATGGEKGTGLGLAITKRIVEMHGGKIWAESCLGEGSDFYVSIPMGDGQD